MKTTTEYVIHDFMQAQARGVAMAFVQPNETLVTAIMRRDRAIAEAIKATHRVARTACS